MAAQTAESCRGAENVVSPGRGGVKPDLRLLRQGGAAIELSGKYSVFRGRSDGTWEVFDTGLPTPLIGCRTAFGYVNGDRYPDAVQSGAADGRWCTWMNRMA
jgi:hypothetical protein